MIAFFQQKYRIISAMIVYFIKVSLKIVFIHDRILYDWPLLFWKPDWSGDLDGDLNNLLSEEYDLDLDREYDRDRERDCDFLTSLLFVLPIVIDVGGCPGWPGTGTVPSVSWAGSIGIPSQ